MVSQIEMAMQYSRAIDRVVHEKMELLPEKFLEIGEKDLSKGIEQCLEMPECGKGYRIRELLKSHGYEMEVFYPKLDFNTTDSTVSATIDTDKIRVIIKKVKIEV